MSYTNATQLRKHLGSFGPLADRVRSQSLVLAGTSAVRFYGSAVESASFIIKGIRTLSPVRQSLTLASGTTSIGTTHLVDGSVVVASDSSLGAVYSENADFIVDYDQGSLSLPAGSALSAGESVVVWYVGYTLFELDKDYRLDTSGATVTRMAGGDIGDGETVFVDFAPLSVLFDDDLLALAAAEANGLVEREVDPSGKFGADPVLGTAAAYRGLEIVCRSSAMRELADRSTTDRTAASWLKLADSYGLLADRLLKSFRPPATSPASPSHT